MTPKTKAATIGALAAATAILLAYSAFSAPAFAATPTSTTTSTSASTTSTSQTSTNSTMCANMQPGQVAGPGAFAGQAQIAGPGLLSAGFQGGRMGGGPFGAQAQVNLTVGQTITVTSTSGQYFVASDHSQNGTASGTLTFTVTGKLAEGYTLSITSGSVVVDGTTYTVSSGSAQMDRSASQLQGQGTTSSSGTFIVTSAAHGSFAGSTASMSLDLSNGSTEYLVFLSGTIQG
jgi:hypothetical protein